MRLTNACPIDGLLSHLFLLYTEEMQFQEFTRNAGNDPLIEALFTLFKYLSKQGGTEKWSDVRFVYMPDYELLWE